MHPATTLRRIAQNQALFREANDRIELTAQSLTLYDDRPVTFICECPKERCTSIVQMTLQEYEEVRANGRRFFALHGHDPEIVDGVALARVVDSTDRYEVLEKLGEAGDIADELDRRS